MKRIRLTATAVAASSLGSLGLAGLSASSAHAAVTPNTAFSGKGFDACAAPSDAQMDDWYAHSPYRGVGVYIGGSSYLCGNAGSPSGGYTAEWVQHQAATGWAMWAIYAGKQGPQLIAPGADPAALGATDAADAVKQMQQLGFGNDATIFVDMEPYHEAATAQAVTTYLKSFGNALSGTGYKLGLYGNSANPATDRSPIGDAAADPALRTQIAAVDIAGYTADQANFNATTNDPYVPASLWAKHQRIHQYMSEVTRTYGSTTLKVDENQVDLAPTSHVAFDPAKDAVRWAGNDRIGTAVAVSQQLWPKTTGDPADFYAPGDKRPLAKTAVLTRSDYFADALGGSALAAHLGGPLLLSSTAALDKATAAELTRTLPRGATVYLLGGEAALSSGVEKAVQNLGFTPKRLAGSDRYTTATAIASAMATDMRDAKGNPAVQRVLLATAQNFPDALAAGTAAGATPDTVLVLTNDAQMPAATSSFLGTWAGTPAGANVYPVGGAANKAAKTLGATVPAGNLKLDTLVGKDRYETATLVARQFFSSTGTPHVYGLATGLTWADALSGGAAMGTLDGPLLLTDPKSLPAATRGFLSDEAAGGGSIDVGAVFGGTAAVSNAVFASL
ncbi:cell wall-binding repeat-containing protein [Catenulispora subtropica]|uniref:Rv2525c-like glycoside hydrolase-like domain-containing protein n=1 Tax=Catenulispora subtropica TaxID=450798 RepID=A0ABN2TG52_9ACTN